ncbi:helix-turn-helix domain-containing protein [Planctomyces sp. SH-PL14]|uniref:helix-turn-helix domain-containing protein n=1 Tax=Planctomyces sp. SH-PL14 TaxID=1632864 RepID=UPI00078C961C|nr:helix-turn-helix domain-containing protein [Planctomyces sp. SH-PL14]AMV16580.1 Helix-turn-helix domain protein [Planctomyces sp. SH-PL14]
MIDSAFPSPVEAITELQLLTAGDVARILQTTREKVTSLVRSGSLKPTKTLARGNYRFSRDDIRRWIEAGEGANATAESAGVAGA